MTRWLVVVVLGAVSISSQAALHGRVPAAPGGTDFQAYYDDLLDVTWVADTNLAASNTFGLPAETQLPDHPNNIVPPHAVGSNQIGADGLMEPGAALHWLDAMNAATYLGASNWRMPMVVDIGNDGCNFSYHGTDCGWNVNPTTGEMAHLYYVTLGNEAYTDWDIPPTGAGLTNRGPFVNWQTGGHWYGMSDVTEPESVWRFDFFNGAQYPSIGELNMYVWAVRDGDLAPVPVPAAAWLLGSALLLLGWMSRSGSA